MATQTAGGLDVSALIHRAKVLEAQKQALAGQIDSNRKLLRLLDENGALDEKQGEWLDAFHPHKEPGGTSDPDRIKRTREVRATAVREVNGKQS